MIVTIANAHQVIHANMISTAESFAVSLVLLRRKMRMTIFVAIVDIGPTMILEVPIGADNAILKSLAAQSVEFIRRSIPGANRCAHLHGRSVHDVRHRHAVSTPKTLPISLAQLTGHIRMAILIAVIHVGLSVILVVLSGSFDSVVETPPLNIIPGVRRSLPVVAILAEALRLGPGSCRVHARRREQHKSSTSNQCCELKLIEIHLTNAPFVSGDTPARLQAAIVLL